MTIKIFPIKSIYQLNSVHKNFYIKYGFIIFRNLFKKKEMNMLDKRISKHADENWHNIMNPDRIEFLISQTEKKLAKLKNLNEKVDFISEAMITSKLFRSYLVDRRVGSILNKLTSRKFVGLMTHVIFKHAKTKYSKLAWVPHQDNSYAKMKRGSYVTTNLFLHDANKKNGCLYLYPKSHKEGLINFKNYYSYTAKSSQNPGNRAIFKIKNFQKIDLEVKKGDFLVMNGNLIHGSYGNYSKKYSRHMLSFNYGVKGEKFSPGETAKRMAIPLT